jgi:hypothetical protein
MEGIRCSKYLEFPQLPALLPLEGVVRIELEDGVPVFRVSDVIQARIEDLVMKQGSGELSAPEEKELDRYEDADTNHPLTIT